MDGPRQVAAAALVRGLDLAAEAALLVRQDCVAGVGLLARSAWESWLAGTFVLHGGLHSYLWMMSEQIRQERVLTSRNAVDGADRLLDERQAKVDHLELQRRTVSNDPVTESQDLKWIRLSVEEMALRTGPLREAATNDVSDITSTYDLFYRAHSAFDSHGLRVLERRIVEVEDHLELGPEVPWLAPDRAIAIAVLYLSVLAVEVFEAFGVGIEELNRVQDDLQRRLGRAASDARTDLDVLQQSLRHAVVDGAPPESEEP